MKPLESGCHALVVGGPSDNLGKVVTCVGLVRVSTLQSPGIFFYHPEDVTGWLVQGDTLVYLNRTLPLASGSLVGNGYFMAEWLMRIDDDSDVKGESNPYVQKLQDDATKKKPLVPLIFSKFGPHPFFKVNP